MIGLNCLKKPNFGLGALSSQATLVEQIIQRFLKIKEVQYKFKAWIELYLGIRMV